jgi:hypothetical protein
VSVPPFSILAMNTLTDLASFEALLSPNDGSASYYLRVFALNASMAIEKLIVNLPLDWQGDIQLLGEQASRRFLIFPRFVCESLEEA